MANHEERSNPLGHLRRGIGGIGLSPFIRQRDWVNPPVASRVRVGAPTDHRKTHRGHWQVVRYRLLIGFEAVACCRVFCLCYDCGS